MKDTKDFGPDRELIKLPRDPPLILRLIRFELFWTKNKQNKLQIKFFLWR